MTTEGRRRRIVSAAVAFPLLLVAVLVSGVRPAAAHAALVSSSPAEGSELADVPAAVTLVFTEEVTLSARSVQVLDPRGRRVDDARPTHPDGDSRVVRVGLRPGAATKTSYTVSGRVVSVDGHPVSGTFSFGVGVPAGAPPPAVAVNPATAVVHTLAQLASYAGSAVVVGGSVLLFVLWPQGQGSARLRRVLVAGVAVAGAGAVMALFAQGPYVAGRGLGGLVDPGLLGETFGSSYGRPLLLRVLAVALSVPVLGLWPRVGEGDDAGPGAVAAAGNMVLLAASFALTGHAAEATPRLLAETADSLHLVAAGVWLGGLTVLALAFLPEASPDERSRVLPRWSLTAMGAVGVLVVTGTYQAWREVRVLDALPGTAYGRLLLGKLAGVVVVLTVAALARAAMGAQLRAPGVPAGRLRTLVGTEAVLGLAVLGVTSLLVATPPARTSFAPPFSATVTGQDVEGTPIRISVDVAPTRVGAQTLRLHAYSAAGAVLPFVSATGELRPGDGSSGPVTVTFTGGTDGQALATGVVPSAGVWSLTVQLVTDTTTAYAATTTYTVR